MEPRPSKPARPTTPAARPPASPYAPEPRSAQPEPRPISPPGGGYASLAGPDANGLTGRHAWYDPDAPPLGAAPAEGAFPRPPLTPVATPRGERRGRFLGPIIAALLLAVVIGGSAVAIKRAMDGDDQRDGVNAAQPTDRNPGAASPVPSATTAPPREAAADPDQAAAASPTPAPRATSAPTEPAEEEAAATPTRRSARRTPTPEEGAAASSDFEAAARSAALLPRVADLPDELAAALDVTNEGARTKEEVAGLIGDEGLALLDDWAWRENAFRDYGAPEGAVEPRATSFLNVSIHRFGRRQSAAEALDYLADVVASTGYRAVDIAKIGDQTRALSFQDENANIFVLYIRIDSYVIRLGGSSIAGDPAADVVAVAEGIVERREASS